MRDQVLWSLVVTACLLGHLGVLAEEDEVLQNLGDNVWHFPNYKDHYTTSLNHKNSPTFLQEKAKEQAPEQPASVHLKDPKVFGPATASIGSADSFPAPDLGSGSAGTDGMVLTSDSEESSPEKKEASNSPKKEESSPATGGAKKEEGTLGEGNMAPPESGSSASSETDSTAADDASGAEDDAGGPSVMEAAPLGLTDASSSESSATPCHTEKGCPTKIVKSLTPGGREFVANAAVVKKKGDASKDRKEEKRTPLDVALEKKDKEDPEIKKLKEELQATVEAMKSDKKWINNVTSVIQQYRNSINQRKGIVRKSGKKYFDLKRKIKERTEHNFRALMKERLHTVSKALHMVRKESDKIKSTHSDLNAVRNHLSAQIANFQREILALKASEYFDR